MARTKKKKEPMKTIKISEARYYDLINRVNSFDRIIDSVREMNDMYLSDLSTLETIKYKFVSALDLEWNRDTYRYEPSKGEEV